MLLSLPSLPVVSVDDSVILESQVSATEFSLLILDTSAVSFVITYLTVIVCKYDLSSPLDCKLLRLISHTYLVYHTTMVPACHRAADEKVKEYSIHVNPNTAICACSDTHLQCWEPWLCLRDAPIAAEASCCVSNNVSRGPELLISSTCLSSGD